MIIIQFLTEAPFCSLSLHIFVCSSMAQQEGSEGSVANSSTTPNFWDLHTSSWNNVLPWHPQNHNSNSSCEEEISISNSFTNTSNHSGLSDDSSRHDHHHHHHHLIAPPASSTSNDLTRGEPTSENHLWSQVLLSVGNTGDLLHGSQDVGENFLEGLSSKNLSTTDMFEPACDYLKKMDNGCSWEFPSSASFNNLEKQLNSSTFNGSLLEHERLSTNLSNLVSNWSIALPLPTMEANGGIIDTTTNSINHNQFSAESSDLSHQMKHLQQDHTSNNSMGNRNGFYPCYGHQEIHDQHSSEALFLRSLKNNDSFRYQLSAGDPNNKYYNGLLDTPWSNSNNTKNLSDIISFNGRLLNNKPMVDIQSSSKHCLKASPPQLNNKKHGQDSSLPLQTKGSGRGSGKKRCDDNSETVIKKPKHESSFSTASGGVKVQAPKVKLGERITALQQIVSPFGKTDTASVLQEAIGYIKFLQEQVQLLSNPYVKVNTNKDPWGLLLEGSGSNSSGRKEKAGGERKIFDLKSKGLCLVPISCIPQVYRENTGGSDYWTPTYRGSLYR